MKIEILNEFNTEGLTDGEVLFLHVVTKFCRKYGYDIHYTMSSYDIRMIFNWDPYNIVTKNTVSKGLQENLRFAFYSERMIGFELQKPVLDKIKSKGFRCGFKEIEIKDPRTLKTYFYILGALHHSQNWVSDKFNLAEGGSRSMISPLELYQLQNEGLADDELR